MRMRLDDLEIVLTVVDAGGFSAAADILDVQVAKMFYSVSQIAIGYFDFIQPRLNL